MCLQELDGIPFWIGLTALLQTGPQAPGHVAHVRVGAAALHPLGDMGQGIENTVELEGIPPPGAERQSWFGWWWHRRQACLDVLGQIPVAVHRDDGRPLETASRIPAEHPWQPHHTGAVLHRTISVGVVQEPGLNGLPPIRPDRPTKHPIVVDRPASRVDLEAWLGQAQLLPETDLNRLRDVVPLSPESWDRCDLGFACAAVGDVEIQAEAIVDIALGLMGIEPKWLKPTVQI